MLRYAHVTHVTRYVHVTHVTHVMHVTRMLRTCNTCYAHVTHVTHVTHMSALPINMYNPPAVKERMAFVSCSLDPYTTLPSMKDVTSLIWFRNASIKKDIILKKLRVERFHP